MDGHSSSTDDERNDDDNDQFEAPRDDSEEDEFVEAIGDDSVSAPSAPLSSTNGDTHKQKNGTVEDNGELSEYGGRTRLPALAVNRDVSILQLLKHCIGKDLSTITMPVIINEPLGFLQRLAEHTDHCNLILQAAEEKDKLKRVELVAAFAISNCANNAFRMNKPFNPLLGETYELKRKALANVHYISEQVSHHPPVSAYVAEIPGKFRFTGSIAPEVHFRGKHVDVTPSGIMTLELPEHEDVYTWESPRLIVDNLIFGKMQMGIHGDLEVKNHTNSCRAVISFPKSTWFGEASRKLEGFVYNESNEPVHIFYGNWAEALFSVPVEKWNAYLATHNEPLSTSSWYSSLLHYTASALTTSSHTQTAVKSESPSGIPCDLQLPEQKLLWKAKKLPEGSDLYYNFDHLAMTLNELTGEDADLNLPPTDARFRKDIRFLELGDVDGAASEKHRLEEKQRAARRARHQNNEEWVPLWFDSKPHPFLAPKQTWVFNGKYLERNWTQSPDIF